MNKILYLLSIGLMILLLGCGTLATKTNAPVPVQKEASSPNQVTKDKVYGIRDIASPIDGISITVTGLKLQDPKGDRTKDNVSSANGDYFGHGSGIAKASDYNQIIIDVLIENNTDKVINTSLAGWAATLQDGYKLENFNYSESTMDPLGVKQIPSHNKVAFSLQSIIEKTVTINEINLTYNFLDYNDEWLKAIQDFNTGKLTKDDYVNKFNIIKLVWKLS